MQNNPPHHYASRPIAVLALLALCANALWAENVFVTSYKGTTATTDVTPCPPSCITGASLFGASVNSASTASPAPVIPASGRRVVYGNAATAVWTVSPTNIVLTPASGSPNYTFTELQHMGTYKIYVTKGESGNASPDLLVNMTATGGDLADASGNAATSVPLDVFQGAKPNHVWVHIGYITNNTPNPTLTFSYVSGTIATTGGRWYMDAVWFEYQDPCTGVAPEVGITGPVAAGQTYVNVTGVAEGASNITVYANAVAIGQTNYAPGFPAGQIAISTSALVKDDIITATQTKPNAVGGACTSDPGASAVVGGGPNASLNAFLGCWKNSTNAGPIGINSTAPPTGFPYILKATGLVGGFGSAFAGGQLLPPDACWQTVTFVHGMDSAIDLNSATPVSNTDPFCSLESLVFTIADPDTGPHDIYVDAIMNGDTVVEDFESYEDDTVNTFLAPNNAALPGPVTTYLSTPNSSAISTAHAFDGTKSCRIQWQWTTTNNIRWARVIANATNGKQYPQLDTRLPITVRYLVLPVGASASHKFNGSVSQITNSGPAWTTGTNTLGVTATGSGSYTYQWTWSGGWLANPTTDRTYVIDNFGYGVSEADNGVYTVAVSDGTCTEIRNYAFTNQPPVPTITNQPANSVAVAGSTGTVMSVGADGHVPSGYPLSYQWYKGDQELAGQTDAILTIANASSADVGGYEVVVMNNYAWTTSRLAQLSVTPVAPGTGTGLRGEYWTTSYSTNPFSGPATLTRTDPTVDFNWGTGSPAEGISVDGFTARWFGQVQALGNDTYTFYTISDDGVRLWVNGQMLVNQWVNHAPWTNSAEIALSGSTKYDLLLEYYENAGGAVAQLYWSSASGSIPYQPVLQSQLFPLTYVPPTITLTAPADPTVVTLPTTVNLSATVTTNLALEVNSVGFYTNDVLLTSVATPPYSYAWDNPPVGVYSVSARVLYNQASLASSAASSLTVNAVAQEPVTISGLVGTSLNYTGGAGAQFVLVMSADIAAPMNTWTRVATNPVTPGSFTIPVGSETQAFYRIKSE